jgi:energy-coupling factor transporter ATP-binding protein EcfA2
MSSIAMWGPMGSGKTTFLAALSIALSHQHDVEDRWLLAGVDPGSQKRLVTMSRDLQEHKFPLATQGYERLQWRLSKRATDVIKRPFRKPVTRNRLVAVDLDLIDSSGELVDDSNYETSPLRTELLERLKSSRGIVYVFDPVREAERGDAWRHTFGLCADLTQALQSEADFDGRLPHYLAICVTKFDELPVFETARRCGLLSVDPDDPYLVPHVDEDDARTLFELLLEVSRSGSGKDVLGTLEGYFDPARIRYFVTSAVGFYLDPRTRRFNEHDPQNLLPDERGTHQDRVRGAVRPINVIEPVLWLTEQVARVEARRAEPSPEPAPGPAGYPAPQAGPAPQYSAKQL